MLGGTKDGPREGQAPGESQGVSEGPRNSSVARKWKSVLGRGNRLGKGWRAWRSVVAARPLGEGAGLDRVKRGSGTRGGSGGGPVSVMGS